MFEEAWFIGIKAGCKDIAAFTVLKKIKVDLSLLKGFTEFKEVHRF